MLCDRLIEKIENAEEKNVSRYYKDSIRLCYTITHNVHHYNDTNSVGKENTYKKKNYQIKKKMYISIFLGEYFYFILSKFNVFPF